MPKNMTECSRKQPRLHELILDNIRTARRNWLVSAEQIAVLRTLTKQFHLSVGLGDIQLLNTKWYVTHSGLMRLARRNRCVGINVRLIGEFCEPASSRWVFKAIAYQSATSKGFVGYGDADPSNVSPLVRGAEMRVAETRAVNRALRKAYGIGLCSVEELGRSPARHSSVGRPSRTVSWQRIFNQRSSAAIAGSTLPADPPAQSRSHTREGVRRRFLRHRNPQGCQP